MDDPERDGYETPIGRRAFIGLMVAGLAALFLGKNFLSRLAGGANPLSTGFSINSVGGTPTFDESTWRLTFDGLFRKPATLDYSQLRALPQVSKTRDFYCVEGWGVNAVKWTGVALRTVMERFDMDPAATNIVFHSSDNVAYTDSVTIEEANRDDCLLAYELNGQPLPAEQGLPLRLVLPGDYGYKYVKWVVRVEAVNVGTQGYSGYWEDRGYPEDAKIR
jgi:DMSO/TMAO reductase YedYZ molybdopterin-dependent catalytic subunit